MFSFAYSTIVFRLSMKEWLRSFYITFHNIILKDECKRVWIYILHMQKTEGEGQIKYKIKFKKLKRSGKGERETQK